MKIEVALALGLLASAAVAVGVDGIAAKVDTAVILRSDVINELRRMGADASRFEEVRNDMIERKLIVKAAEASKMTIQEWVIDNRIRELIAQMFNGDRNRLMEALARQKISYPEWRQRIREDMIVSAMRWQVVDKNVTASPAEVRAEYAGHPERYALGRLVTVSVILLKPEDAEKREKVDAALKDEPFADVARRYSAGVNAAKGGVWKDVNPEESFRPEVCAEIERTAVGKVGKWIELDGWNFLIRKDAESAARKRSFTEAYDDIVANVKEAKAKKIYEAWLDRLRSAAYISIPYVPHS